MLPEKILTAEEVLLNAKESYYNGLNADSRYESAYCLGWLQSSYDRIADELRAIKEIKTKTISKQS